jgi:hypothetical protein
MIWHQFRLRPLHIPELFTGAKRLKLIAMQRSLFLAAALLAASSQGEDLTNRFGFAGREIFPIDNAIAQLKSADLNGDGKTDLVVINNARSKITLLMNRTGETNAAPKPGDMKRDLNELPPDARFKIESLASEKRISSLVIADLNSDKHPDIAYYGEPKELLIQYHDGTNTWLSPKRFAIDDGLLDPYALVTGDLNGDKRTDLLLLAEGHIYFFAQTEAGALAEPEKIPYAGAVKSLQVLDIQGDGRDDLMLVNWDSANPFRFRLQNSAGRLGPEIHFTLPPIRSYWADDLDGDHKAEIVTIAQKSGRAQIANFLLSDAEPLTDKWKQGQFEALPLAKTSRTKRGVLWADLNSDRRSDLIVAEPDSGQLTVYLQRADGSFEPPKSFPTLTGITELAAADWNGDGSVDIFALSSDERQVALTKFDDKGHIAFPKPFSLPGRPMAMAVGKLKSSDPASLAVLVDGETARDRRELILRDAKGNSRQQKLAETFKGNPSAVAFHDIDQDGLTDIVILIPYEKMKILRQVADKDFEEIDLAPPGGSSDQPWLARADVDGDGKEELLLAQKNFLRAVVLEKETNGVNSLRVREQINGSASNSRIVAGAALREDGAKIPNVFLFDAERKVLTVTKRDDAGVWQIVRNLPLPITDFTAMNAVSFHDGEPDAISLQGVNTVAWMALRGQTWQFKELDGYETPIKDGFLRDVLSGDLNSDGRRELIFLETAKNYIDIVAFDAARKLAAGNRWQVFEERTFRSRRNDLSEPREAIVADVTGDGKNDLIVVVHDRIIVYPQE